MCIATKLYKIKISILIHQTIDNFNCLHQKCIIKIENIFFWIKWDLLLVKYLITIKYHFLFLNELKKVE